MVYQQAHMDTKVLGFCVSELSPKRENQCIPHFFQTKVFLCTQNSFRMLQVLVYLSSYLAYILTQMNRNSKGKIYLGCSAVIFDHTPMAQAANQRLTAIRTHFPSLVTSLICCGFMLVIQLSDSEPQCRLESRVAWKNRNHATLISWKENQLVPNLHNGDHSVGQEWNESFRIVQFPLFLVLSLNKETIFSRDFTCSSNETRQSYDEGNRLQLNVFAMMCGSTLNERLSYECSLFII